MITCMQLYRSKNMGLLLGITFLVGIVLFPYGWLAKNWEFFDQAIDTVFTTEWMHVVGHSERYPCF